MRKAEGEKITCPKCGEGRCIPGQLQPGDSDNPIAFAPLNIDWFLVWPSVPLDRDSRASACLDCGHVWSSLEPDQLKALLLKRGRTESTLARDT